MARIQAFTAWLCSSLGAVLLAASILVVPANAFADLSSCESACSGDPLCIGGCVSTYCAESSSCEYSSCSLACGADPTCLAICLGGACAQDCGSGGDPSCLGNCCLADCGADNPACTTPCTQQAMCAANSANRACDNGCMYSTSLQVCISGCVTNSNTCATCKCLFNPKNDLDCFCQSP